MMTTFFGHLDASNQRFSRWSGAAGIVVAVHVGAFALAMWTWPKSEPEREQPGAIMMDLPPLAMESASDQTEVSERTEMTQSAPPPSPAEDTPDQPPQENQAAEAAPEVPPPAPVETPPVEEAPLAPEPEVVLPKEVEPAPAKPKEPEKPKEEKTEPKKEKAAEKKPTSPAPKSDSKQQQKAAASSAGKFDPSPIYRANPAYPAGARSGKIQGSVVVSYSVSPSGAVTSVRVVSASPPGVFNAATLAAVRQWRFKPSASGGTRTTTVRFKLK